MLVPKTKNTLLMSSISRSLKSTLLISDNNQREVRLFASANLLLNLVCTLSDDCFLLSPLVSHYYSDKSSLPWPDSHRRPHRQ